jgi:hypothetical protein
MHQVDRAGQDAACGRKARGRIQERQMR